jgi:manganese transport protein
MSKQSVTSNSVTSLEEVHRSVTIPRGRAWRRLFAFAGPAYLVSVGYMDPGNWATDLEGGARFGYQLIWVLLMSNAMAVLLQTLSARLGLVTGRDLAQACHDDYPPAISFVLFLLCEVAIAACDLAEVLGTAVGLNLLFGIPVLWAVIITGADVFLLLLIQRLGIRRMEAVILGLISIVGLCFVVEILLSRPSAVGIASGFIPRPLSSAELYVAIGILGATVMPHNLYLHSALVQSRNVTRSREAVTEACRYNLLDSAVAMNFAFLVNAAILIMASATFWSRGIAVAEIQQAHRLLHNTLGSVVAPIAFAVALICAGQSSTLTGTLAGQVTMEGFLRFRMRPWLRRLITRATAIVPAVIVILATGEHGVYELLILSQVVLSLQLPFAVVPLVRFTSSRQKMGCFASPRWIKAAAWTVTGVIVLLNGLLVSEQIRGWIDAAGAYAWIIGLGTIPVTLALGGLLAWMAFRPEHAAAASSPVSAQEVARMAAERAKRYRCIGVALEAEPSDAAMLAEAVALARIHGAELVLIHVVEGPGSEWHGPQTGDRKRRQDETYLEDLRDRLRVDNEGLPGVRAALGYGNVSREIVRLCRENDVELLVLGGHGHRGIRDWLHGETIPGVRHGLNVPILAVGNDSDSSGRAQTSSFLRITSGSSQAEVAQQKIAATEVGDRESRRKST